MTTHAVTNQPPPRVDLDEFATNRPLVVAVERYDAGIDFKVILSRH